jgi:hypothetical protein
MRIVRGQSLVLKEEVPDEPYDPRIEVSGDVKGKAEQMKLFDLDIMDTMLFSQMNIDVFQEMSSELKREVQFIPKPDFLNLFNSATMNLWDLPVLGTTGEASQCTKFPIRRVNDKILWLDMIYPIHVEDIHQLTGLSWEGEDVSKGFQGSSKHDKKKEKIILYECYHTQHGGRTVKIEPNIIEMVRKAYYVISNKAMHSYYKGECMLDALLVEYFCVNGAIFNWCSYLLEEFLIACEEVQEKENTFTYGYLLLSFAML